MRTPLRLLLALALAALTGLAASCSTSAAPPASGTCDESTCTGCCADGPDGGSVCVPFPQQGFSECGRGAAACRACVPGQICEQGQCLQSELADAGVDAGGDAGVDAGTDAGSDAGTDAGSGVCGHAGEACCHGGACYLGLACNGSTCEVPSADAGSDAGTDAGTDGGVTPQATGAACTVDGECQTGHCELSFAGGYCTKTCLTDTDCAQGGGKCGYDQEGTSLICLATCPGPGGQSTCRSGYVCDSASSQDGVGVCVPKCTTGTCASCNADGFCCGGTNANTGHHEACCAGAACGSGLACQPDGYCAPDTGPKATGSACGVDGDCAGDLCIPQASGADCGYTTSDVCWAGGYCSQSCQQDGTGCAAGSSCAGFGTAGYLCLDDCAWDGGQGGCRSGYVCDRFVTVGENSASVASCVNACGADADCPASTACASNGFCCGAAFYRCCDGNTCNSGLSCQTSGANQGYCM